MAKLGEHDRSVGKAGIEPLGDEIADTTLAYRTPIGLGAATVGNYYYGTSVIQEPGNC